MVFSLVGHSSPYPCLSHKNFVMIVLQFIVNSQNSHYLLKAGSQYDGRLPFRFVPFRFVPFRLFTMYRRLSFANAELDQQNIAPTPSVVKKNAEECEKSVVTSTFTAEEKS